MSPPPPAPTAPWTYRLLALPLRALAALPLPLLYGLAGVIYLVLAYVVPYRRRVVQDNLRHAFPELPPAARRRLARRYYWHLAQVLVEILKLTAIGPAELGRRLRFTNPEVLAAPLAQGRVVLVLGSHLGNWEWLLGAGARQWGAGGPVAGVYKVLQNKFFEYFTYRLRTRLGAQAVPMPQTLRHLLLHQQQGRGQVLSLLLDQAAGPLDRPYWTPFLHRPAGFYTSAERLAARFDCVVLYVGIRRLRRGYYEAWLAPLPHPAPTQAQPYPLTEAFARQLEADIRATPEQYLWSHRRWKYAPPA